MKPCLQCGTTFYCEPCKDVGGASPEQKYCGKKCYRAHYYAKDPDTLLWERVDKNGPNGCWIYRGACDRRGYGRPGYYVGTAANGNAITKRYYAHRRSYEIHKGPIPAGMLVLHRCDNPPCCNPEHLFLGTDSENRFDCVSKDRHARGERAGAAKLTDDQVREIKRAFKRTSPKKSNATQLAQDFGVSLATIGAIVRGSIWRHIT